MGLVRSCRRLLVSRSLLDGCVLTGDAWMAWRPATVCLDVRGVARKSGNRGHRIGVQPGKRHDVPGRHTGPQHFPCLAWTAPLLFWVLAGAAACCMRRSHYFTTATLVASRRPINRVLASVVLGLAPVMFFLLRLGEPDGVADQIGVVIAMGFWFLLPHTLRSWITVEHTQTGSGLQA